MQFSDVLASSIHDIKNSLSLVLNTLDELLEDPSTHFADRNQANVLRFEASRVNNSLIQLLMLYKMDGQQLSPNVMEHNVEDFLDEIVAANRSLVDSLDIEFSHECDPWLSGYFDDNLVQGVLNSAIGNAERYTRDAIRLSACEEDGYLVLRIEDNGGGFPAFMLEQVGTGGAAADSFNSGSTQLGLYFASQVAGLHVDGERHGRLALRNNCALGGGCFELWLP